MATIGTNVSAANASFYLNMNNDALTKSIKRLASGSRLADPTDDAAGVAVSGKLDATVKRLQAASEGAQIVVSFGQTADGFMKTMQDQLTRMSELAQRATNGAFGSADRANYATEFTNLSTQISNIATNAKFNGASIFTTTAVTASINSDGVSDTLGLVAWVSNSSIANNATQLNINISALAITSVASATAAIASLTTSIENVTKRRADLNADIAKFNFHIQNVKTETLNVQTANGRIKDLDVAEESTLLARNNILLQASTAMLAQANASQQSVLSLLK